MRDNVTLHTSGRSGAGTPTQHSVVANDEGEPPETIDDIEGFPGRWYLVGFQPSQDAGVGAAQCAPTS